MTREFVEFLLITMSGVLGTVLTWLIADRRGKRAMKKQQTATQNRPWKSRLALLSEQNQPQI